MAQKSGGGSTLALARQSLRQRGLAGFVRDGWNYLAFNFLGVTTDFTQQRFRLSERLADEFQYEVRYGPFAGMKLARESWWSAADRGSMLLGLYENEVLQALERADHTHDILVDIGAADGYYAIGCLKAGWVSHSYCYEITEEGRAAIARNAEMNELQQEFGIDPGAVLIIMDIEGSEQALLSKQDLQFISRSKPIIEIHEDAVPLQFVEETKASAFEVGLAVNFLSTGARVLSSFPELKLWSDDDRWMLCSEGRNRLMRWMVLTPENDPGTPTAETHLP